MFNEFVETVRMLQEYGKSCGSIPVLEGYIENIIRSTDEIERLCSVLPDTKFVFDPFNVIYEHQLEDMPRTVSTIFDSIGERSVVAHAKDLVFIEGQVRTPRSGTGVFDWDFLGEELNRRLPNLPIVLEHLSEEEIPETLAFVKEKLELSQ